MSRKPNEPIDVYCNLVKQSEKPFEKIRCLLDNSIQTDVLHKKGTVRQT